MQRLTRPLVALLTGAAMLFLMVQPSAATSPGTIHSGVISVNVIPTLSANQAPGVGPCPTPVLPTHPRVTLTATSSGTPANQLHATLAITNSAFTYLGSTYLLSGITVTGTGPLTGTTYTLGPFTSTIGNIYSETAPGSCQPGTARCAGVRLSTITPLVVHGTFAAGHLISTPTVQGSTTLTGTGHIQAIGCTAPFSALNGKQVTLTTHATFP